MTDKVKSSKDKLNGTKDRSNFGHASNQRMPENVDKGSVKKDRWSEDSIKYKSLRE